MAAMVTVNDVLDGHVGLDVECLDRIYLNGYVPNLQVGGQVASFMTAHLGYPIPSPAIMEKIGTAFRRAVDRFADDNKIPVVRFGKDDRKIDRMRPYLARQARDRSGGGGRDRGGAGVRAGVHRDEEARAGNGGVVLVHQGRPAGHLLLLLPLGRRFRAGVRQGVRLFPVPDEDLAQRPRVGQTAGHQDRDRVHRAVQRVRHVQRSRWAAGDLRPARPGRDPGVRRTLVVDPAAAAHRARPRRRLLVGAVDAPGRDLAHPGVRRAAPRSRVLRGAGHRQPRHRPPGTDRADLQTRPTPRTPGAPVQFKTKIVTYGTEVNVNAFYRHSRIKQYLKDGRALRIETVINDPGDLGCLRRLVHLDELQARARAVNTALLDTERVGQGCVLASPAFERIARPTLTEDGRRAPALRFGDPRVQALAGALCTSVLAVTGITNKSLRALMTGLLGGANYTMNQASYDLARLRVNGLITRIPGKNRYRLTGDGLRFAIFYTKLHDRLLRPCSPPINHPHHHHCERHCTP